MKSILVFRPGALGDLMLAGPALVRLRRAYSHAEITLAARTDYAELLCEALEPVEVVDVGGSLFSPLFLSGLDFSTAGKLLEFLRRFDLIVAWMGKKDEPFGRNIRRAGVEHVVIAEAHPAPGSGTHASDYLLGTVADLCAGVEDEPFRLQLPGYIPQTCDRLLADSGVDVTQMLLAVHPGSGSPRKCWPVERFASVAAEVARRHRLIVAWLLGPAELEQGERFCADLPDDFVVMASIPLMMLAGVLQRARVYLGNDSGITHLAAALGTATVALFGPSDPRIWAPRGEHVEILQQADLGALSQQTVLDRLMQVAERVV